VNVSNVAERPRGAEQGERVARFGLFLSGDEYERFVHAVAVSGAPSMSFLVGEAVEEELAHLDSRHVPVCRRVRVDVRLPVELTEQVSERARVFMVPRQALVRYMLFQYVEAERWKIRAAADAEAETR